MKLFKLSPVLLFFFGILLVSTAKAAEIKVPITNQVAGFYKWALGIGGLVALGIIVFGGILYAVSAGNASKQDDAKQWVTGALIGLVLLFGSYLILNTINPDLTVLKDVTLERNLRAPTLDNPVSAPITTLPLGERVTSQTPTCLSSQAAAPDNRRSLKEAGISCNDYGGCSVHSSGCALLNESGVFCSNNYVAGGNCRTKLDSTLINNLLAAEGAGFNIYVTSSVCSTLHAQTSFHYRTLGADLNLPSSDAEIRKLMTFLSSRSCIHDLWGPSRFSGLCADNGRKGVACSVPNHENHLHYDVQPNCK
ncbi:MAG: pilin [Candidatus Colwellbacteria bacterium]|nr:pilin [Candidatus Colwellbacteria bacterium]